MWGTPTLFMLYCRSNMYVIFTCVYNRKSGIVSTVYTECKWTTKTKLIKKRETFNLNLLWSCWFNRQLIWVSLFQMNQRFNLIWLKMTYSMITLTAVGSTLPSSEHSPDFLQLRGSAPVCSQPCVNFLIFTF